MLYVIALCATAMISFALGVLLMVILSSRRDAAESGERGRQGRASAVSATQSPVSGGEDAADLSKAQTSKGTRSR